VVRNPRTAWQRPVCHLGEVYKLLNNHLHPMLQVYPLVSEDEQV
jgi:hypothetical protein